MMDDHMKLKFYMHDLDSLLVILVYGFLFLSSWIVSYDVIFGGVTIGVTPCIIHVFDFIFHAYAIPIALEFCMLILLNV